MICSTSVFSRVHASRSDSRSRALLFEALANAGFARRIGKTHGRFTLEDGQLRLQ